MEPDRGYKSSSKKRKQKVYIGTGENKIKQRQVLILGAGFMQMPAIKAAKKLLCKVIAVDGNPNAVCAAFADRFEPIDLKDIDKLIDFALKTQKTEGLSAVFTAATDFSYSASLVAQACNLPGHSPEAALNSTDKIKMRSCFYKHGVPSPAFTKITEKDIPHIERLLKEAGIDFPAVIKPCDNMGARGCRTVFCAEQLLEAVKAAVSFSRSKTAIAEQFISKKEFSIEGLVFDGKIHITALADRHIFFPPYFVEMGHTIPSKCTEEEEKELVRIFKLGVKSLGLTHGAVKGDIFLKEGNTPHAFIGEIAARLSGGYMSGWTVPYSSGLDVTEAALKLALGETPCLPAISCNNFSAERAWISVPGEAACVLGLEEAAAGTFIKEVFPRITKGDKVFFPSNNVEKCGNVISSAPSYNEAAIASIKASQKVVIRLKPDCTETENFLKNINDAFDKQDVYPPNFFCFPSFTKGSFSALLKNCNYKVLSETELVYPECFEPFLHSVKDIQGRTLQEALLQTVKIEPKLKAEMLNLFKKEDFSSLSEYWLVFIRGSIQGLLYIFDTRNCY